MSTYRYPGVNYFKRSDHKIFHGRKKDTQRLLKKILINRTMILHAESGIGKSSLVRAGLIPAINELNAKFEKEDRSFEYKRKKILPLIIRRLKTPDEIEKGEDALIVDEIKEALKIEINQNIKDELKPFNLIKDNESLWYLIKQVEFIGFDVLFIFDQFEEIQTYKRKQILHFEQELSSLFQNSIPDDINDQTSEFILNNRAESLKHVNELDKLEKNLSTKALFVIREDRLGVMSLFSERFPNILQNNFYLGGLDHSSAKNAIVIPASLEGDFESSQFTYDENVVDKIIEKLTDKNTHYVDPLQIQIICRSLERKIIGSQNKRSIKQSDLGSISNILNEFYKRTWDKVNSGHGIKQQAFTKIKKDIISKLVVSEKRVPVIKETLSEVENSQQIIDSLEKLGFLRKLSKKETFYELSHDRLINPLLKDLESIRSKEKEDKKAKVTSLIIIALIAAVVILTSSIIYYNKSKNKQLAININTIISLPEKDNFSFSYFLAKQFESDGSNEFSDNLIKSFDNDKLVILSDIIPLKTGFRFAEFNNNSKRKLQIYENDYSIIWDLDNLLVDSLSVNNPDLINVFESDSGKMFISKKTDSLLEIRDRKNKLLDPINGDFKFISADNFCVSKDLKFLLNEDILYDLTNNKPLDTIPSLYYEYGYDMDYGGQMNSTFLNDGKHLAIGYWSGYTIIYNIDTTDLESPIKFSKLIPPLYGNLNSVANRIAVDSKDSLILVGNRIADIAIWKIGELKSVEFDDEVNLISLLNEGIESKPDDILNAHMTTISSISLSPDDSSMLSASEDGKVVLWDLSTKEIISTLSGVPINRDIKVGFLNNDEYYIVHQDERLSLWFKCKNCNVNKIFKFNPYNFQFNGINTKSEYWSDFLNKNNNEETQNAIKEYYELFNYITNFPIENYYVGNNKYLELLKTSVKEIEDKYKALNSKEDYINSVNEISRFMLADEYFKFKYIIKPNLLLPEYYNNNDSIFNRKFELAVARNNLLLDQFFDNDLANKNISNLANLSIDYYINKDNETNWRKIIEPFQEIDRVFIQFEINNNTDNTFLDNKAVYPDFANLFSFIALKEGQYKHAIYMSQLPLKWNPENWQIANIHLALAYILSDQWDLAEPILLQWKDKYFGGNNEDHNKEKAGVLFLKDIKRLIDKEGINHPDFEKAIELLNSNT